MKKILIPTDFSDNAWNAMQYASSFFGEKSCTFIILHSYTIRPDSMDNISTISLASLKETSEHRVEKETEKFKELPHHSDSQFETVVMLGEASAVIEQYVKEKPIDYIVMGTKGASGLAEILIGTNTFSVAKRVKCPVLCIPENATFRQLRKIVFAADYKAIEDQNVLLPLKHIAQSPDVELTIINVNPEGKISEKEAEEGFSLHVFLEGVKHEYFTSHSEDIEQGILDFVHRIEADMLVMIKRDHSIWESLFTPSITQKVAFHTDTPFLILHESPVKQ